MAYREIESPMPLQEPDDKSKILRTLMKGQALSYLFVERPNDLNRYPLYFPEDNPKQLDQDEIIEILNQAKAPEWHAAMVAATLILLPCLMKNPCLTSQSI
jgi:hypothetical protein